MAVSRKRTVVLKTIAIVFPVLFVGWEVLLLAFYLGPRGPAELILGHYEGLGPSLDLMGSWEGAALVLLVFACVFWHLAVRSGKRDSSDRK